MITFARASSEEGGGEGEGEGEGDQTDDEEQTDDEPEETMTRDGNKQKVEDESAGIIADCDNNEVERAGF